MNCIKNNRTKGHALEIHVYAKTVLHISLAMRINFVIWIATYKRDSI